MSDDVSTEHQAAPRGSIAQGLRAAVIASGIVAIIAGVAILIWPVKSAVAVTILVAIYTLIAGLVNIATGVFARSLGGWLRGGLIVLGALFLVAGVLAFANLEPTTVLLAAIVATMLGIAWIVDGVLALATLGADRGAYSPVKRSRGWTIAFAILSIVAGVLVILSPLWAALWLWVFIGASLLAFGIVQIVRAATLER